MGKFSLDGFFQQSKIEDLAASNECSQGNNVGGSDITQFLGDFDDGHPDDIHIVAAGTDGDD